MLPAPRGTSHRRQLSGEAQARLVATLAAERSAREEEAALEAAVAVEGGQEAEPEAATEETVVAGSAVQQAAVG